MVKPKKTRLKSKMTIPKQKSKNQTKKMFE